MQLSLSLFLSVREWSRQFSLRIWFILTFTPKLDLCVIIFNEIYTTTCYCMTTELSLFNPMYLADLILWLFFSAVFPICRSIESVIVVVQLRKPPARISEQKILRVSSCVRWQRKVFFWFLLSTLLLLIRVLFLFWRISFFFLFSRGLENSLTMLMRCVACV